MSDTSREQTMANGPGSGESAGGGAVSRSGHFDFPQPSEGDPLRGGSAMLNRSPMYRTFSRSSSGYFSVDSESVPGSPLMPNIFEAQDDQNDEVWIAEPNHHPVQMAAPVRGVGPELAVARELRRIGDEFNRLYCQGAGAGGNNAVQLRAPNEHALVIWMNDLLGRLVQFFLRRR